MNPEQTHNQEQPLMCLHCESNERLPGHNLCGVCITYPKCEGCGVIFGQGFSKPSQENPKRCDSCLDYEQYVRFKCASCGQQLPLFYSPNSNVLHYLARGNFCSHCNGAALIASRERRPRDIHQDFIGYLGILSQQLMQGKVTAGQFEEAKYLNPHDIINPALRVQVEEDLEMEDLALSDEEINALLSPGE